MDVIINNPGLAGNIALGLFLFLLLISCIQDEFWKSYPACGYYLLWGLGGEGLLLFAILADLEMLNKINGGRWLYLLYLIFATISNAGLVFWALEMVREKVGFRKETVSALCVIFLIVCWIIDVIGCITMPRGAELNDILNTSWFAVYFVLRSLATAAGLLILIFYNLKKIGKPTAMILILTLVMPLLTMMLSKTVMEQWAKCVTILMFFVVYLSMWKSRGAEFAKQEMLLFQKDSELAAQKAELARKEMELTNNRVALMVSQIQPHFLYNTLSSIARLCTENPEQARKVAMDFSSYFRENLRSLNSDKPIPFLQELEHTETYLNIELARFPDTLHVDYNICAEDFFIPALTLQPIVENAVKHGITRKEGGGNLYIESFELVDAFEVTVTDDGVGFEVSEQSGEEEGHIGINSVRQRLMSQCQGALIFKSQPGEGTVVTIYLPKEGVNA